MPDVAETKVTHRYQAAPEDVFDALQRAVAAEGYDLDANAPTKLSFEANGDEVTIIVEPEPDGGGTVVTLYDQGSGTDQADPERGWQAMLETVEHTL